MIPVEHFQARRDLVAQQLTDNSALLLPAASLQTRSNDTEYPFRQNSDFYYLTGFNEADAWFLLRKSAESTEGVVFCLPKDKQAEIWHGRRLGIAQAPEALGLDAAFELSELETKLIELLDGLDYLYYPLHGTESDSKVLSVMERLRNAPKQSKTAPTSIVDPLPLLHKMRLCKDGLEVEIMRKAADISVAAHRRAMLFSRPGAFEYQLEAELHHEFLMHGARSPAYGTIVGSGDNACILHYTENSAELADGALVLIDAGAELEGYAADITRTFPVNGKFSEAQRAIYDLVLKAQLASLELYQPGNTLQAAADVAIEVITMGLMELGILNGTLEENIELKTYREYYMHGLGHYLGLDVHDVGNYKENGKDIALQPGMVLTIEPGIYIAPDADVDEKWRGIGVRIEDNVLITAGGHEVLTAGLEKSADDIEALMAKGRIADQDSNG